MQKIDSVFVMQVTFMEDLLTQHKMYLSKELPHLKVVLERLQPQVVLQQSIMQLSL